MFVVLCSDCQDCLFCGNNIVVSCALCYLFCFFQLLMVWDSRAFIPNFEMSWMFLFTEFLKTVLFIYFGCTEFSLQRRLLIMVLVLTSLVAPKLQGIGSELWHTGLLTCSVACGIFPDGEIECLPLAGRFFTTEPPGKPSSLNFESEIRTNLQKYS